MKSLKTSSKNKLFLFGGLFLLIITAIGSMCVGSASVSLSELFDAVFGGGKGSLNVIFWHVRFPRVMASCLSGAALAVSGCVLQSLLSNKLVSPGIIGVNAGAGLGVTLCTMLGATSAVLYSASAFVGALVAALGVMLAAYHTRASKTTVILGGVAINSVLNAISESISVLDNDVAIMSAEFRVGGFSAVSQGKLLPAAILIIAALVILFTLCNELDVLSLGDDSAKGLGMNVKRTRIIFLLLAALLAGSSVSFAGLLGFVGLIVPNFLRRIAGDKNSLLLPLSAIYGALFVTVCDTLARVVFSPYELPVGIVMAIIGGPVFIALLVKNKGGHRNA